MRKMMLAATVFLAALGCEPLENLPEPASPDSEARVRISAFDVARATKSSLGLSETDILNLNVYAYRGGMLEEESFSEGDGVDLVLQKGITYSIYALANCGEVHAPAAESDLASVTVSPSAMAMCYRDGGGYTFSAATNSLELPLTRLFAKYTLVLDRQLENCDFAVTSVMVKQRASTLKPFTASSCAEATSDGDFSCADDLAALNSGQGAVFYVPENCQGVLLPGNEDPWLKIPENIPEAKRSLCTYLAIEGEWTTGGASADLDMNLMLGCDNCTDFNVVRNSSVTITLTLTDSGTLKSSWKVDMDNLDDQRVLSFQNASQTIMQEDGWTLVPLTVSPADMAFTASFSDSDDPVMEAKVEDGKVYVRALYDGDERPVATLTVSSWDGRHTSSTQLTLDFTYGNFNAFTTSFPKYYGEYGYIRFTDADESNPVVVNAAEWSVTIGPSKSGSENYLCYRDSSVGLEYHVLFNQKTIYIRSIAEDAAMYFEMTQYKSRAGVFMDYTKYPSLKAGDAVISEAGNRQYDSDLGLWYDNSLTTYLADSDGNKLDLESFKIPEYVLPYRGMSGLDSELFSDLLELYGIPEATSGSAFTCLNQDLVAYDNCRSMYDESIFSRLYYYGTTDYDRNNTSFTSEVTMPLASGDTLRTSVNLTKIQAFPSQRYLGDVYNYQIAPSSMRSYTTDIDFTSGGTYYAPTFNSVTWDVVHADGLDYNAPAMAFSGGSSDAYSSAASMSGSTMSFTPMSSSVFPACGCIGLKGTVTNPHSGRTYTGYYTLSLILYVSVGCQIDFMTSDRLGVDFVPFCEYAVRGNREIWAGYFPSNVKVLSGYTSSVYGIGMSLTPNYDCFIADGFESTDDIGEAAAILKHYTGLFTFSFSVKGNTYTSLTLDMNASALASDEGFMEDGSKGFYKLVRQYDIQNFLYADHKYYGLENYIIEAAYESLDY